MSDSAPYFQNSQIICLEYQNSYLYAEVIDIVQARQICWGRPLMLVVYTEHLLSEPPLLYDLRAGADLLLPITLFRAALDTELIPLLAQLEAIAKHQPPDAPIIAHRKLKNFIQQVWQAHPDNFKL
ncbi:MAG: hypothetical protein N3E45_07770 [Oscillatoriaceae bacterium SKW80]|nr:hypothetical protein [Oscillatoriaceae bacterium SKYG93]MCX8120715.1 hypothetical protein [Oscillatoriaceae bacterium SKW80]MDW8453747.1 hypothetical protein [Oscillatoriaceae cyanobacterium SKYGB_i_bin93]HIK26978.1 hypothetical protein [Oscillatoriaceae cyanobacterium M7585_C2015_266]